MSFWFYAIVFTIMGALLIAIVLSGAARRKPVDPAPHHEKHTENASHTASGSAERKERKRRRAQSRNDRRKRH